MNIKNIINPQRIEMNLTAQNKDEAIDELSELLYQTNILTSKDIFIDAVHEREKLTTTAIGFGIAIPHARTTAVNEPAIAIGRSSGFYWNGTIDAPITLVFMLAVPAKVESAEYMGMLASIARMLVHEEFREELIKAPNKDEFMSVICDGAGYLVKQP